MLPIVGTVVFAELLGLIETGSLVRLLLAGLAFGAVAGRSVVVWREWGGNEIPPERVRQIEGSWVLVGALASVLLHALA